MVSKFIERIALLQAHGNDKFPDGMFESFRENKLWLYMRPDSNIFGTASVAYILKSLEPLTSELDGNEIDKIIKKAKVCFELYQNKDGLKTYNFWQTKPSKHFPNGYLAKYFRHFKLPDDIDDTALIYLTNGYSEEESVWLKEKLKQHAISDKVYSTWFGDNMPLENDVCALCNLMCFLFESKVDLNEYDLATLYYLNQVIVSEDFLKNTFWVSRHYATVSLVVYHYARLLGRFEVKEMEAAKLKLLEWIPVLFKNEGTWINKVLLQTAFIKLKGESEMLNWEPLDKDWEYRLASERFYSFIGAPFAPLSNDLWKGLASKAVFQIGWKCKAHELALVLENVVLRNKYFEMKS